MFSFLLKISKFNYSSKILQKRLQITNKVTTHFYMNIYYFLRYGLSKFIRNLVPLHFPKIVVSKQGISQILIFGEFPKVRIFRNFFGDIMRRFFALSAAPPRKIFSLFLFFHGRFSSVTAKQICVFTLYLYGHCYLFIHTT